LLRRQRPPRRPSLQHRQQPRRPPRPRPAHPPPTDPRPTRRKRLKSPTRAKKSTTRSPPIKRRPNKQQLAREDAILSVRIALEGKNPYNIAALYSRRHL